MVKTIQEKDTDYGRYFPFEFLCPFHTLLDPAPFSGTPTCRHRVTCPHDLWLHVGANQWKVLEKGEEEFCVFISNFLPT